MPRRDGKPTYDELAAAHAATTADLAAAHAEIAALEEQIKKLLGQVGELQRATKRQAAPFSKGKQEGKGKKPGRKKGNKLWSKRAIPEHVDETYDVVLPDCCPDCGSPIDETRVADQYQTDIPPVTPITRRFRVHVGKCSGCAKRLQGRHPLQTSDALDAAAVQLGPRILSIGALLNKKFGQSWGKVAAFSELGFNLSAHRSTFCRAAGRLADKLEPTYQGLIEHIKQAEVVYGDETGWRIGGDKAWMWVLCNGEVTVYFVRHGRGFAEVSGVLGPDFAGTIGHDGWHSYPKFTKALHQTCLAHLFKRAKDLLKVAEGEQGDFPTEVLELLKKALTLRDRRDDSNKPELSEKELNEARGLIIIAMHILLHNFDQDHEPNEKFAAHLRRQQVFLFRFLFDPDVEATNWMAEHAMRPVVVNRKVWGGNRTERGAHHQGILSSIIRTCHQNGRAIIDFFLRAFHGLPLSLDYLLPEPSG